MHTPLGPCYTQPTLVKSPNTTEGTRGPHPVTAASASQKLLACNMYRPATRSMCRACPLQLAKGKVEALELLRSQLQAQAAAHFPDAVAQYAALEAQAASATMQQ